MTVDQDVAKLGAVRPPLVYLASILLGALLQFAAPLPLVPQSLALPLGASLIVVAIALFASAVTRFRAASTGRQHAGTGPQANHDNRPYRPVSLQPEPHLSGVLTLSARDRDLGQQPVAAGHTGRRGGPHPFRRRPKRGGVPGTTIRESVPGVQGLRAPLAVAVPRIFFDEGGGTR
jgi:hypothetical protein